jgi:protocatechuate 3,4-dioxygenase beta subunit
VQYTAETQGPYPSDGSNVSNGGVSNVLMQSGVLRSDIRSSFNGSSNVAAGVPLTLTITLANSNNLCAVLPGAAIYIWHCTRDGAYSLYAGSALAENYLRGVQVADASGRVTFTTIFPGCYSGRYPHIHLEVFRTIGMAVGGSSASLTSQFAMPRADCVSVYGSATGYSASVANLNAVTTSSDMVFGDNSATALAAETLSLSGSVAAGYAGSVTVGVPLS